MRITQFLSELSHTSHRSHRMFEEEAVYFAILIGGPDDVKASLLDRLVLKWGKLAFKKKLTKN